MHYSIWHGYIYTIISLYGEIIVYIKHHFIPYTALHDVHILRILIHVHCLFFLVSSGQPSVVCLCEDSLLPHRSASQRHSSTKGRRLECSSEISPFFLLFLLDTQTHRHNTYVWTHTHTCMSCPGCS